uniref:Uncharacterized protein n=1 Tax=Tanacetum cinerariifolium TaxID=118510 RepID=A0A6L2LQD7_TANCI|nr:hypothetical protein [Tanacetum cinerariifolium]
MYEEQEFMFVAWRCWESGTKLFSLEKHEWNGSKVIKCGAGSSLSTNSASREGDRGDPDFRSLLYGGRSLSYRECFGEAREDGLDREAMLIPLLYR